MIAPPDIRLSESGSSVVVSNSGYLMVKLISATNIVAGDNDGSSDPYCSVSIYPKQRPRSRSKNSPRGHDRTGGGLEKTGTLLSPRGTGGSLLGPSRSNTSITPTLNTRIITKSLNPEWREIVNFMIEDKNNSLLEIKVMDKDLLTDDFLGLITFDLANLADFVETSLHLALERVSQGTISFQLRWIDIPNVPGTDRYGFLTAYPSKEEATIAESKYSSSSPPYLSKRKTVAKQGIYFGYKAGYWLMYAIQSFKLEKLIDFENLRHKEIPETVRHQIDLDIPRTFPGTPIFSNPFAQEALREVLVVYAHENPTIGYCQSMSFVAGCLLLLYPREEVIIMLNVLTKHIIPAYWTHTMLGLQTDLRVLESLISIKLPALAAHFKALRIDVGTIAASWFMTLYATTLPYCTTIRLWDYLFTKGSCTLIRTAFSIFKMYQPKLLQLSDLIEVDVFLRERFKSLYNWEELVIAINNSGVATLKIRQMQAEAKEVIEKTHKQRTLSELKRTNFSIEQLQVFYDRFSKHPKSIGGSIPRSELFNLLNESSFTTSLNAHLKEIVEKTFDSNSDGTISFKEFCLGMSVFAKGSQDQKMGFAFKIYDNDKNGFIDKEEMIKFLCIYYENMGFESPEAKASHFASLVFDKYDDNKDGKLCMDEFSKACETELLLSHVMSLIQLGVKEEED